MSSPKMRRRPKNMTGWRSRSLDMLPHRCCLRMLCIPVSALSLLSPVTEFIAVRLLFHVIRFSPVQDPQGMVLVHHFDARTGDLYVSL